jgi:diaminopimelate epimerase
VEQLTFTKGHGTENDFVLLSDPDGRLDLDGDLVAALCDRRAGVGGDGLIRVVRSDACEDGARALAEDAGARWFMDYRNADGSVAEMCGNGVRVFVAYLLREGLVDAADLTAEHPLAVGSRGGVKRVHRRPGPGTEPYFAVDMGPWRLSGGERAASAGHDALVHVAGLDVARPGLSLDLGNPHTVVMLVDDSELDAVELDRAPVVEPVPSHGTNVELVVMGDSRAGPDGDVGVLRMRVHERGVGETRSCGTGACAAALAARTWGGDTSPTTWHVDVPGGQVEVRLLDGGSVELAGPAALVVDGVVSLVQRNLR